ncbi:hypothetical protein BP6252_07193 [Coleophoma cylindrospora]|uniref:Glycoside hydrolase family 2 protein n=1 Tax=Coleophoma cylindrospora TaxID=1849047 RepID=A0A3D8RH60_9HELO|nr:hypothetical protein BP6252_07193 [Coleophoma cylindrospora]
MEYLPSFIASALVKQLGSSGEAKPVNPLTYPKSEAPFSSELFKNPTTEYRGCPLWAWNTKLDKAQLRRQIDNFEAMGMGGFHMHVRTGLDTQYMGTEFMDCVRECVDYAGSKNMLACLYDDDRWPSGAAGGKVIKQYPEHKGKHILFTPHLYGTVPLGGDRTPSSARGCRAENGYLLATYDVELDENGCLKSTRLLKKGEKGENVWYAYVETNPGSPWFNDQTYVDTLSQEAISKFIETTHEVYKAKVGDKFGTVVPCIFTDEPQFATKTQLSNPRAQDDIFLPWTGDIAETFRTAYSEDLVRNLPEIVWNLPDGKASTIRYWFHDHVCERFVSAHMDQISTWCRKNNIILNGHMMEEPTLYSQTTALGEAMRCYRNVEMPGIDLLCDWTEYNTAKQASSVARQNGIRGTMSEIYGVTHWYFTFEGHKGCGDWQAALGITFRVHHLTWVSMAGEGKRDYPACIGYQSPWFKEYGYVEDHFARVGVVLTRGKALTRVAVIHPIESYWLSFGPNGSGDEQGFRDQAFGDLSNWLLHGLIDFDFIAESLLPRQIGKKRADKKLAVGHCEYEVVIVPNLRTIRSTTLKILRDFARSGGRVIVAGSSPSLVDASVPSSSPFIQQSTSVFWSKQGILGALEEYRDLRIVKDDGISMDNVLYQMREEGKQRYVFVCNRDRNNAVQTVVQIKGAWDVENMDTFTGEETPISSKAEAGWTSFPYRFEGCASLLLRLSPRRHSSNQQLARSNICSQDPVKTCASLQLDSVTLSEPNVLMLDYASFKLSDTDWSEPTEVLRIDNVIREHLQMPRKGMAWTQPWAIEPSERESRTQVTMRFVFESAIDFDSETKLALEDATDRKIILNDILIPSSEDQITGWWVDEAIKTVTLPADLIKKGTNTLCLEFPFGILTNVERIYLLGSFGVSLSGHATCIQPLDLTSLTWGNITTQLLPFYVGNVTYNCTLPKPSDASSSSSSKLTLAVPQFSSPVLTVTDLASEKKLGRIALQPHVLSIPNSAEKVAITAFGNRYNSFGHIHVSDWLGDCSPEVFRTGGAAWTDDYMVKPIGVLECPTILSEEQIDDQEVKGKEGWILIK